MYIETLVAVTAVSKSLVDTHYRLLKLKPPKLL